MAKSQPSSRGENPVIGVLAKSIRTRLGPMERLLKVAVLPLWGDRFRVNVLVGIDAVSATVGESYFVVADGEGNIVSSVPELCQSV